MDFSDNPQTAQAPRVRTDSGGISSAARPVKVMALAEPRRWFRRWLFYGMCALWVSGCKVGPDYVPPCPVPLDPMFQHAKDDAYVPAPSPEYWWTQLGDPVLANLVHMAVRQNLDLREAYFRIMESRGLRGVVRGNLFPRLGGTGAYSRRRISANGNQFVDQPQSSGDFDLFSTGFDAAWELDVFGKFRRGVEAAEADLAARVEERRGLLVTLLGDVATQYVQLRGLQARTQIAEANLRNQEHTLHLVRERQAAGLVGDLDVAQAEANVATTAATFPPLRRELHVTVHRLSVLLGQVPSPEFLASLGGGEIPVFEHPLGVGLPGELLRRRPDIRQAEREVAAQNARIGVATADLYPQFSLTGNVSVDSRLIASWFTNNSLAFGVGPSARWDILQFGRIKHNIRAQRAKHQQTIVNYQRAILLAVEEVENALVSWHEEQLRRQHLLEAHAATLKAVGHAREQYVQGLVAFQTVLDTQRQQLQLEDELARNQTTITLYGIQLYKALGGGWHQPFPAGLVETSALEAAAIEGPEVVWPADPRLRSHDLPEPEASP